MRGHVYRVCGDYRAEHGVPSDFVCPASMLVYPTFNTPLFLLGGGVVCLSVFQAYSVSDETSSRQVAATGDENPDAGAAARARSGSGIGDGVVTFEVSYSVSMGWAPGICEECMAAASDRADVERSVFQVGRGVGSMNIIAELDLGESVCNIGPVILAWNATFRTDR